MAEVQQLCGRIADTHDLRAKSTARATQGLGLGAGVATEPQSHLGCWFEIAPDAF